MLWPMSKSLKKKKTIRIAHNYILKEAKATKKYANFPLNLYYFSIEKFRFFVSSTFAIYTKSVIRSVNGNFSVHNCILLGAIKLFRTQKIWANELRTIYTENLLRSSTKKKFILRLWRILIIFCFVSSIIPCSAFDFNWLECDMYLESHSFWFVHWIECIWQKKTH